MRKQTSVDNKRLCENKVVTRNTINVLNHR